jgi:hypothetical protein
MILGKLVTLLLFGDFGSVDSPAGNESQAMRPRECRMSTKELSQVFLSTILNRLGARWAVDSVLLEQWASKAICLLEKL